MKSDSLGIVSFGGQYVRKLFFGLGVKCVIEISLRIIA